VTVKKVLFITSVYKPNVGGIETCVANLSKSYQKIGIKTAVLTKKFPFDLPEYELIENTPTLRVARPQTLKDYIDVFAIIEKYRETISGDIIHLIGIRRPMPLIGLLLSRLWRVPFVVSFAGGDLPNPDDPETIKLWQEGLSTVPDAVSQADCHISFSGDLINLARKAILSLGDISLVFAGIDLDRVKKSPRISLPYPYFFAARRLSPDKGIDILIRSFAKVTVIHPEIKLLIAGSGNEKDGLVNLVNHLDISDRVEFLGELEPTKVFGYMKGALAHICPSRAEGGGIVNLEAQAAGCLSIGSNIGGIPEYIKDKETGLLFESQNIDDLAKILISVTRNSGYTQKIIDKASANIENFDWEHISRQHLDLYTNVVNSTSLKPITFWDDLTRELSVYLKLNDS